MCDRVVRWDATTLWTSPAIHLFYFILFFKWLKDKIIHRQCGFSFSLAFWGCLHILWVHWICGGELGSNNYKKCNDWRALLGWAIWNHTLQHCNTATLQINYLSQFNHILHFTYNITWFSQSFVFPSEHIFKDSTRHFTFTSNTQFRIFVFSYNSVIYFSSLPSRTSRRILRNYCFFMATSKLIQCRDQLIRIQHFAPYTYWKLIERFNKNWCLHAPLLAVMLDVR